MKLWLLVALFGILVIVVAQNSEVTTVHFLFWEVNLSRVVLLLLTFALGAVTGFVGAKLPRSFRSRTSGPSENAPQ